MNTYNTYDFNSDVGLITSKCCDNAIDMNLISETIKKELSEGVTDNIEKAKNEIIDTVKNNKVNLCGVATKDDIHKAVHCINHHTDVRFDEIDFHCQFENLNKQIKNLKEHGKRC